MICDTSTESGANERVMKHSPRFTPRLSKIFFITIRIYIMDEIGAKSQKLYWKEMENQSWRMYLFTTDISMKNQCFHAWVMKKPFTCEHNFFFESRPRYYVGKKKLNPIEYGLQSEHSRSKARAFCRSLQLCRGWTLLVGEKGGGRETRSYFSLQLEHFQHLGPEATI